jgi:hypothetical protein
MKLLISVYTTIFQFTDSPCRTCFLHAGCFMVEYQRHCTVSHTNICVALNFIINIVTYYVFRGNMIYAPYCISIVT